MVPEQSDIRVDPSRFKLTFHLMNWQTPRIAGTGFARYASVTERWWLVAGAVFVTSRVILMPVVRSGSVSR